MKKIPDATGTIRVVGELTEENVTIVRNVRLLVGIENSTVSEVHKKLKKAFGPRFKDQTTFEYDEQPTRLTVKALREWLEDRADEEEIDILTPDGTIRPLAGPNHHPSEASNFNMCQLT